MNMGIIEIACTSKAICHSFLQKNHMGINYCGWDILFFGCKPDFTPINVNAKHITDAGELLFDLSFI